MGVNPRKIKVVDLFCGIGGLTYGFIKEGLDVIAGIDNDSACKFGYEYNNGTTFIQKDITEVTAKEINQLYGNKQDSIRVLVGCAPCQPFSKLNIKRITKKHLQPLEKFAQLIDDTKPDVVSMENVSGLADENKYPTFRNFISILEKNKYEIAYEIVDASDYGVPQNRKRLVLLASRLGKIELVKKTHKNKKRTVRDVISHLPPLRDGEICSKDPLHKASKLNHINLRRIKATPPDGGNSRSWKQGLILRCHKKDTGESYRGTVYGRMRWEEPAPTMTTQCVGLGNGRFGHPEQHRAITLREAAIFQTFPKKFMFLPSRELIQTGKISKFIGNAVPVRLAVIIGRSIKTHIQEQCQRNVNTK